MKLFHWTTFLLLLVIYVTSQGLLLGIVNYYFWAKCRNDVKRRFSIDNNCLLFDMGLEMEQGRGKFLLIAK